MKCKKCGCNIDGRLKLSKLIHLCKGCAKKMGKYPLHSKTKLKSKSIKITKKKLIKQKGG